MDLIMGMYYLGAVAGLFVSLFLPYWRKHKKDPTIVFNKKYFVPFLISFVLVAIQVVLDLIIAGPLPYEFTTIESAFGAGFALFVGMQEFLKEIMKNTGYVG
ncbi:MAG: hypothetical protein ACFFEV_09705 [Candidatus Thorarchaeota archaeon]